MGLVEYMAAELAVELTVELAVELTRRSLK